MTAVLLTRPAAPDGVVATALAEAGYRVHTVPTIAIEPLRVGTPDWGRYDWAVLTSANAVRDLLPPPGVRVAAVGEATAGALRGRGVAVELIPPAAHGAALAEAIPVRAGMRVLLLRGTAAAPELPRRLRERGAEVDELRLYRTIVGPPGSAPALAAALADADLAGVVFASGSAVQGFLKLGGTPRWPAITIGPRTSAAALAAGFRVAAEAQDQSGPALVEAVRRALSGRQPSGG